MRSLDRRITALEQRYQAQPVVTSRLYEKLETLSRRMRAYLSEEEIAAIQASVPREEVLARIREMLQCHVTGNRAT